MATLPHRPRPISLTMLAALALMSCGEPAVDDAGVDGGRTDGGAVDSGAVDAGAVDSGAVDSGAVDAGAVDAGADAGPCPADVCIRVAQDGTIDPPAAAASAGQSVAWLFANRWHAAVELTGDGATACDDESLEAPWEAGGLTGPMPHLAGGVVVRGSPDGTFRFPDEVWESDAISGVLLVIPWRDLEPTEDNYDFSVFTDALREATRHGKVVSVGVQAGARTPSWLFTRPGGAAYANPMVTMASGGERCFDQVHPSFWHADYVELLTELQSALSAELRAHAGFYRAVDKIKISGVNLLTSETRMPVSRSLFCGFDDATCSNGPGQAMACAAGTCPLGGTCGCFPDSGGTLRCGRTTDDLPQVWADAGYRRSTMQGYFRDLFEEQTRLFPDKDINLMQIARAFPNVREDGTAPGFADPDDVRALIDIGIEEVPDRFVVLNAALAGGRAPQDLCLEAHDSGAAQIGFQTVNGIETWEELQAALDVAVGATTPGGDQAVSFVEIYLSTFVRLRSDGHEADLRAYDEVLRRRSPEPVDTPIVHRVEGLAPGTYHFKIAGAEMSGGACNVGSLVIQP